MNFNKLGKKIKNRRNYFFRFFSELPLVFKILKQKSYFSEQKRKSKWVQFIDNIFWLIKSNEANQFYQLYGLDIVGSKPDSFMDYWHFMNSRNRLNKINTTKAQTILLRDKYLFYQYMSFHHLPVPEVFAFMHNGELKDSTLKSLDFSLLKNKSNYFIKEIDGECASFIKKIRDFNHFSQIKSSISKGNYVLQKGLTQNFEMAQLYPEAINTLRIVTINNNDHIQVLSVLLRIGTKETGNVDNWAKGGIAIGVEKNGFLKKYGFYKPSYGTKTSIHPDTNVVFEKFQIPNYQEALDLACKAHEKFYGIHSIGWDIALTTDGPMIIEGNDNWEISLMQACDRGLRQEWTEQGKPNRN